MPGTVVLVRHGATEWSESGRHTSRTDLPLLPAGRRVATALEDRFVGQRFAVVRTSPRARAVDTASLAGLGGTAVADDDLAEWDYGDYEGLTTAEIREAVPGWTVWTHPCPGGETAEQVGARADAVLERIRPTVEGGGDAALFGHGHALRVLAARWLGQPPAFGAHLVLGTATVSVLGFEREAPALLRWNT